jgi:hypothetical protein
MKSPHISRSLTQELILKKIQAQQSNRHQLSIQPLGHLVLGTSWCCAAPEMQKPQQAAATTHGHL